MVPGNSLMNEQIGSAAGKVFSHLMASPGKPVSLDTLRKTVGGRTVVFHMAIGWLAREDKLVFSTRGRTAMVALSE